MNANELTKGLEELAGEAMPATTDLWPRVRARVGATPKRRATPRRRAIALISAAVLALALTLAGLTPTGTNAATGATTGVLNLFGLQPLAVAPVGPGCLSGGERKDPVYTPATPTDFTIAVPSGLPQPATMEQVIQIDCPAGYALSFTASATAPNAVLSFFGLTTSGSAPAGPGCVNSEGERAEPIRTPLAAGQITSATPSGAPLPPGAVGGETGTFTISGTPGTPVAGVQNVISIATAAGQPLPSGSGVVVSSNTPGTAVQLTCPAGYGLTFIDK